MSKKIVGYLKGSKSNINAQQRMNESALIGFADVNQLVDRQKEILVESQKELFEDSQKDVMEKFQKEFLEDSQKEHLYNSRTFSWWNF